MTRLDYDRQERAAVLMRAGLPGPATARTVVGSLERLREDLKQDRAASREMIRACEHARDTVMGWPSADDLNVMGLTTAVPASSPEAPARLAELQRVANRQPANALTKDYRRAAELYTEMIKAARLSAA